MTPYEYLIAVEKYQEQPDELKKTFAQSKQFILFNDTMKDKEITYSPHDGIIQKMKFHKNGILSMQFSTAIYSDDTHQQLPHTQLFDIFMKVEKIPNTGLNFKTGNTILDIKFNEHEFAINFIDKNNNKTIEKLDISSIDVSKAGIQKSIFNKFIPKQFQKTNY